MLGYHYSSLYHLQGDARQVSAFTFFRGAGIHPCGHSSRVSSFGLHWKKFACSVKGWASFDWWICNNCYSHSSLLTLQLFHDAAKTCSWWTRRSRRHSCIFIQGHDTASFVSAYHDWVMQIWSYTHIESLHALINICSVVLPSVNL